MSYGHSAANKNRNYNGLWKERDCIDYKAKHSLWFFLFLLLQLIWLKLSKGSNLALWLYSDPYLSQGNLNGSI